MNKKIWPEVEYRAADRFIRRQVAHYGHHLDEEESLGEAWRAYLEADNTYSKVEGCCSFPTYAAYCIEECLEQMRQKRNAHISLESRLSLEHNLRSAVFPRAGGFHQRGGAVGLHATAGRREVSGFAADESALHRWGDNEKQRT